MTSEVGLRYTSWPVRVLSAVIDLLLVGVLLAVGVVVARILHPWLTPEVMGRPGSTLGYAASIERSRTVTRWLVASMLLVVGLLSLVNTVVVQGLTGRTLGKFVTGQRLIDPGTGRAVGVGRAFLRQLAHTVDALPCYLGFFWPLIDEQRRTFADMVAKTVVVRGRGAEVVGAGTAPVGSTQALTRTEAAGATVQAEAVGSTVRAESVESASGVVAVGPTLREVVAAHGPLDEPVVRDLALRSAQALAVRHDRGGVHGRVGPDAVRLTARGAVLTDESAGPALLRPPEAVLGQYVGPAADIFALGSTLVYAATGNPPFGSGSDDVIAQRVVEAEPDLAWVPAGLRDVLASCLAKQPGDRPTAAALVGLFGGAAVADAQPASPSSEIAVRFSAGATAGTETPWTATPVGASSGRRTWRVVLPWIVTAVCVVASAVVTVVVTVPSWGTGGGYTAGRIGNACELIDLGMPDGPALPPAHTESRASQPYSSHHCRVRSSATVLSVLARVVNDGHSPQAMYDKARADAAREAGGFLDATSVGWLGLGEQSYFHVLDSRQCVVGILDDNLFVEVWVLRLPDATVQVGPVCQHQATTVWERLR
ncbi:RDD family protein [Nocardia wallacei]|uniref:RDD family protein n=1 Tax=Nocardia wallacei TaxID=480035 RepID=UPI002457186E|nr:RDD family protein [Nocardia wallacei]